jgi:hypothetical protein
MLSAISTCMIAGAGKNPILRSNTWSMSLPLHQVLRQIFVEWNRLFGCFRLALAHDQIDDRAFDPQQKVLKIYVPPLKTCEFSPTQADGHIEEKQDPAF